MLMVHVHVYFAMELLPLLCLCLLTQFGSTFADGNEPNVLVAVQEKSDAVLPCSINNKENIEKEVFDWKKDDGKEVFLYADGSYYGKGRTGQDEQFKDRVLHFEDELKNGNASIKIKNTIMADTGSYTCTFPNQQTSNIKLVVGAASKPYVTILNESKDGALLHCEVHGTPKPHVEWRDKAGTIIPAKEPHVTEREGHFYITLQTTVTKADHFRCVAIQEEIKHQIHAEIYVPVSGAAPKPSFAIVEQTKHWALLQCEVFGASPKPNVYWQDSSGNILPAKEPQVTSSGGSFNVILQINVTKTDRYHCIATQEEINHQIQTKTHVYIAGKGVSAYPAQWSFHGLLLFLYFFVHV